MKMIGRLVFGFLLGGGVVAAQEGADVVESFVPKYSAGEVWGGWNSDADFDRGGGGIELWEAGAGLSVPVFESGSWRLTSGVRYRWTGLEIDGGGFPGGGADYDLHRLEVPVSLWWQGAGGKWRAWVRAVPGLAGDFSEVGSDDFAYSVLALVSYQWTETVRVSLGAYYSDDLGAGSLLPAVGVVWEPNRHWSVALTAPRLQVAYAPDEDWLFALRAYPSGGSWRVDGTGRNAGQRVDLDYSSVRVGLGVERRVGGGPAWVYVDAGVRFAQSLEIEGGTGRGFDEDLEAGASVMAGVKLRF